MILALLLITNIFASFISNRIKARFDEPFLAEHYMLQMLVRFASTVLVFGYFLPRTQLMAFAVIGPFLTLATTYVVKKNIERLHQLTMIEHKLVTDIIQVLMLALVCLNSQYFI